MDQYYQILLLVKSKDQYWKPPLLLESQWALPCHPFSPSQESIPSNDTSSILIFQIQYFCGWPLPFSINRPDALESLNIFSNFSSFRYKTSRCDAKPYQNVICMYIYCLMMVYNFWYGAICWIVPGLEALEQSRLDPLSPSWFGQVLFCRRACCLDFPHSRHSNNSHRREVVPWLFSSTNTILFKLDLPNFIIR